jgi:hypothetical protein
MARALKPKPQLKNIEPSGFLFGRQNFFSVKFRRGRLGGLTFCHGRIIALPVNFQTSADENPEISQIISPFFSVLINDFK